MENTHIKLTCICDDYVEDEDLLAEHGLSFLIETESMRILFDTGQGKVIEHNMRSLKIDVASVDTVILSHGHYDHTGGLEKILKHRNDVNVYAHPEVTGAKYRRTDGGQMKYIGFPRSVTGENKPAFIFNREPFQLSEGILLTGQIPRRFSFEEVQGEFQIKSDKEWKKDNLLDDQALVIDTPSGLILILGCTHSGLINTLTRVVEITGKDDFLLVAGGTHLKNAGDDRLNRTITALDKFRIQRLILSHCTGVLSFCRIHQALGDKASFGKVGQIWHTA